MASRLQPDNTSNGSTNGSVTATQFVLEYDNGLPEPSQTTSSIATNQNGSTTISNGLNIKESGIGNVKVGVVGVAGLTLQMVGTPSTFSRLSRRNCTDRTNPCSLTLTGSKPGMYATGIDLPSIGDNIPEVSVKR